VVSKSGDAYIANWSLELNERVGSVVGVGGASLAARAEVSIVTDGTLVAVALNIALDTICRIAKWSVTVDAVMTSSAAVRSGEHSTIVKRFVDWYKSVTRMNEASIWQTS
jgi:hypothetical protein